MKVKELITLLLEEHMDAEVVIPLNDGSSSADVVGICGWQDMPKGCNSRWHVALKTDDPLCVYYETCSCGGCG